MTITDEEWTMLLAFVIVLQLFWLAGLLNKILAQLRSITGVLMDFDRDRKSPEQRQFEIELAMDEAVSEAMRKREVDPIKDRK